GERLDRELRDLIEQRGTVEPVHEEARQVTGPGVLHLEIEIEAAKVDRVLRDVGLVGLDGRVGRQQKRIVSGGAQCGDEGVVAQAVAADGSASAGCDVGNAHQCLAGKNFFSVTSDGGA